MVVDNKGTISYIRVLKEDLSILRITPLIVLSQTSEQVSLLP